MEVTDLFQFSGQQQILYDALLKKDKSLASMYFGALKVLADKENPERLALAAHSLRELIEKLPRPLDLPIKKGTTLKNQVNNLSDSWHKVINHQDYSGESPWEGEINASLKKFLKKVQIFFEWLEQERPNRKKQTTKIIHKLDPSGRKLPLPISDLSVEKWNKYYYYFQGISHHTTETIEEKFYLILSNLESFLLDRLYPRTFEDFSRIDEIIREGEADMSSEVIQKALDAIKISAHYEYFFTEISSPDWITPLWEADMFKHPNKTIEEGKFIGFSGSAEYRYLAQMASLAPETVLKVALEIPETDNILIHEYIVDIALATPVNLGIKLLPKIKNFLNSTYESFIYEKVAKLFIKLAKEGEVDASLDLARYLLEVLPPEEENQEPRIRFRRKILDNLEVWQYGQILQNYIPDLVSIIGNPVLEMVCDLLSNAIRFSQSPRRVRELEGKKGKSCILEDDSIYWRTSIENIENTEDSCDEISEHLTIAVRDTANQIINNKLKSLQEVVALLQKYKWRTFYRISFYLLDHFPEVEPKLIVKALTNRQYFDVSEEQDYEYVVLIKNYFAKLTEEKQEEILSWIENLDVDYPWKQDLDERAKFIRYLQLKKLTVIQDSLSPQWQQRYQELVREFGAIKLSDLTSGGVGKVWVGPESPKTFAELATMSDEELISYLKNWQPDSSKNNFFEPSVEGLNTNLQQLTEQQPQRFALLAEQFQYVNPRYSNGLLSGLSKALNKTENQEENLKLFPWQSVLKLCQWIVDESQQFLQPENYNNAINLDWCETRKALASFLKVIFTVQNNREISFEFREKIWGIIQPLTRDPNPIPEYENSSNMEPSTLSINTVRGQAIHAVIIYALWVRRNLEKLPNKEEFIQKEFEVMPEVRQVLEEHLDLNQDPSVAVHSIYGRLFPQLSLIDYNWTAQNATKIFPREQELSYFRHAAWETYIKFCRPYYSVFKLIKEEYYYAVEELEVIQQKNRYIKDTEHGLINHLMIFYWQGYIILDDPDNILNKFYQRASDKLRGYAIEFIGRSLRQTKDSIESEILNRLYLLWETRFNEAKNADNIHNYTQELAKFGWWFASDKFEDAWAIKQLKQVLQLVKTINFDVLVVERLAIIVQTMPLETIECLSLILKGDSEWRLTTKEEELKTIFTTAIQGTNEKAKQGAIALINHLGAKGDWKFRDLLPLPS